MDGVSRCKRFVKDNVKKDSLESVRLACLRFKKDLKRKDIYFDESTANTAIRYIEMLPHTKGKWQGRPTILEDWQCFWVANIFGWKWKANGLRRFRYAYVRIPRKNGKSHIAICIALVYFAADGEPGAEVYLGATAQDHVKRLLLGPAKYIVENCSEFREHYGIEVNASNMTIPANYSRLDTVIKKPADGDSPHFALVDEYHEHEGADQYDTFDTGMAAREQPLLHVVTTAGTDLNSPCKSEDDECLSILNETLDGDTKFVLIYKLDETDKWDNIASIRRVNPNLGVSIAEERLVDQLAIAKRSAEKQNAFRTKHCNEWVGAKIAWMNMVAWQRQKRELRLRDFRGKIAHIGVDLASKKDIAAIYILFRSGDEYSGIPLFYAPEEAANENEKYQQFVNRGELILTDGNMTDFEVIEKKIIELCGMFQVSSVAFDDWQANYLITRLQNKRIPMVDFGQTPKNMSDPMKEVEALILDKRFYHDGNTCMTWMMGNVAVKRSDNDHILPMKSNRGDERCKIDGPVAAIMAMGRWIDENMPVHAYEKRGFRTL